MMIIQKKTCPLLSSLLIFLHQSNRAMLLYYFIMICLSVSIKWSIRAVLHKLNISHLESSFICLMIYCYLFNRRVIVVSREQPCVSLQNHHRRRVVQIQTMNSLLRAATSQTCLPFMKTCDVRWSAERFAESMQEATTKASFESFVIRRIICQLDLFLLQN